MASRKKTRDIFDAWENTESAVGTSQGMGRTLTSVSHALVGVTGMAMDASEWAKLPTIHTPRWEGERWQCTYCGRWRKRDLDQCPGCGATEVED